jgi:hypothetical protein
VVLNTHLNTHLNKQFYFCAFFRIFAAGAGMKKRAAFGAFWGCFFVFSGGGVCVGGARCICAVVALFQAFSRYFGAFFAHYYSKIIISPRKSRAQGR